MGGDITVESKPGEGSTFWFEVAAPSAAPMADMLIETSWLDGVRVLVVEDVITTGGAVRDATNALRAAGAVVECGTYAGGSTANLSLTRLDHIHEPDGRHAWRVAWLNLQPGPT